MTTNEYERDLEDQAGLKRPGRIDLRLFQNTPDAGDGHPGLQRAFRNYLHEGGMEKDLDLVGYSIKGTSVDINNAELQQLSNIEATTISPAQWVFVGEADQPVKIGDSPTFGGLTIGGNISVGGTVDSVDILAFKTSYDTHAHDDIYYTQTEINAMDVHPEIHELSTTGPHTGTLPWAQLNKTGSNLTDLATRPHSALSDEPANAHHVAFVQGDADALYSVLAHIHDTRYYTETEIDDLTKLGISSDDLVFSNDDMKSHNTGTPTKVKEIICYKSVKCCVYHEMRSSVGGTSHGMSRVYVNGSGVGATNDNNTTTWIQYTDDIEVVIGDKIQIYAWEDYGGGAGEVQNMRIKFAEFKNNDP